MSLILNSISFQEFFFLTYKIFFSLMREIGDVVVIIKKLLYEIIN